MIFVIHYSLHTLHQTNENYICICFLLFLTRNEEKRQNINISINFHKLDKQSAETNFCPFKRRAKSFFLLKLRCLIKTPFLQQNHLSFSFSICTIVTLLFLQCVHNFSYFLSLRSID